MVSIFVLSGVYLFVLSEGGVLERFRLKREIRSLMHENSSGKTENDRLRRTITADSDKKPSHEDLISSGFLKKNDKIIIIRDVQGQKERISTESIPGDEITSITLYRIVWGIVAVAVFVLLYLSWRKSSYNDS